MRSTTAKTIAGFCHQCHSDVQLANGIYSCRCGSTSDASYDLPPNWIFKLSQVPKALVSKVAKAASGRSVEPSA